MTGITKTNAALLGFGVLALVSFIGEEDGALTQLSQAKRPTEAQPAAAQSRQPRAEMLAQADAWDDNQSADPAARAPMPHVATVSSEEPVIEDYRPASPSPAPAATSGKRYDTPPPNGRNSSDMPEGTVIRNFDPRVG
ncbi:MAG: hypothetical protein WBA68_05590, partial [Alteraurantiacibacter sp.]